MTAINILTALIVIFMVWLFYMAFTFKEDTQWDDQEKDIVEDSEVVKVTDISIGHTIYDLFPEWRTEFEVDPLMDELAATCDLYLAAKELLNDGTADVKRIVQLSDAVSKFEKFAL